MRADRRRNHHSSPGTALPRVTSVHFPAKEKYLSHSSQPEPLQEQLRRYVAREFSDQLLPQKTREASSGVSGAEKGGEEQLCVVESVPKQCIPRKEHQAARAEQIVFDRLKRLRVQGLRLVFFQGCCYGGRLRRHALQWPSSQRLVFREHDFVLFSVYKGKLQVTLVEVKSTSDMIHEDLVKSDARSLKNNKRTAQHQLRDHLDVLYNEFEIDSSGLNCHIFWPFLSSETKDSHDKTMLRWKDDKNLHVFQNVLLSDTLFHNWFTNNILGSEKTVSFEEWNILFERYIILSCGVFIDEIDKGMMSLLSQEQLALLHQQPTVCGRPLIIHGAAGTGKTMMIICKLQQLYEQGRLHDRARALYICYWPGIRCDVERKLTALGLARFVDTKRFFISLPGFLDTCKATYAHIFMDECEAICLAFEERIISNTFHTIFRLYHLGNSNASDNEQGMLWFMVDINQAFLFLPKYSPKLLQTPDIVLSKVIRTTISIYNVFDQFYQEPIHNIPQAAKTLPVYERLRELSQLTIGHEIVGPPVYWANTTSRSSSLDTVVHVILDLCSKKGIKPNDICVLSYLTNNYRVDKINEKIKSYFVEGFMPEATSNVEDFLLNGKPNQFLVPWLLRVKGLEFKVVAMIVDDDDFDYSDPEDRRKVYIMASRCTCLLIVICPEKIKNVIDARKQMQHFEFSV